MTPANLPPQTIGSRLDNKQALEKSLLEQAAKRKKWCTIAGYVFLGITLIGIIVPGLWQYSLARSEIQNLGITIYGDLENEQKGLESMKEEKLLELDRTKLATQQQNKDIITRIYKVFPLREKSATVTHLVRLFDVLGYLWHAPERAEPLVIKNIIFGKEKEEGVYLILPIQMNFTASRSNFEQFLYFLETAGILSEQDVFNVRDMATLEAVLRPEEFQILKKLTESPYTIDDILAIRNQFLNDKVKKRLLDRFLAKPLLWKKYQAQVDPQYIPPPLLSVESFSVNLVKAEGNQEIIKNEGEMQINMLLHAYFQKQDTLKNVLQ